MFVLSVSKRDFFNLIFSLVFLAAELSFADAAQVDVYFRKQNAHTLRVASTVIRLLSDQDFLSANPESTRSSNGGGYTTFVRLLATRVRDGLPSFGACGA